jgi:hypothetical protein
LGFNPLGCDSDCSSSLGYRHLEFLKLELMEVHSELSKEKSPKFLQIHSSRVTKEILKTTERDNGIQAVGPMHSALRETPY